jgi:Zn-dependent M16 (insulinase) family peptidase
MIQTPDLSLKPGEQLDGFVVGRVTPLAELRSTAIELAHPASGARILHLHNDDAENLFSLTFPTPPPDDTGLPHILEHCVLGGSKKYLVKDPFFEMVKCSMATFINAMTGSDHTVYPVASNVRQDFYNLADVYWDAVFHPNLLETTFEREGHHLELATKGDLSSDLILKGIVYNEMKGALSSPEAIVSDIVEKSLWPDTPYGKNAGGDPDRIPDLTYGQFKRFHQTHYHPSNAFIFLYGDIPTRDHLRFLSSRLAEFTKTAPVGPLPKQPRWSKPRRLSEKYPVGPSDPTSEKTYINVSWLVGDGLDVAEVLALRSLDQILLGNQAAPLRKALIDSHLGEDVSHAGLWVNGREASFHAGLKGSEASRTDQVEALIISTLKKIADEGVEAQAADAAFQQLAYEYREIGSMYPLRLMDRAVHLWMHGKDGLDALRAGKELKALKERFAADKRLFSRLIEERILNNPHRLTLTVSPDREIQGIKEAAFTEKMRALKASLSQERLKEIAARQDELDELLTAPNPPEALAALPQLHVRDLPAKPRHIPTHVEEAPGLTLLRNDLFANGVNYLQVSFDLSALPEDLWAYLPLYGECVGKMGAAGMDYAAMARRVAAHTGGVGFAHAVHAKVDGPGMLRRGTFGLKFLDEKAEPAMSVLHDLIFALDCTDESRLTDVLMQVRSHHRTRPASEGLSLALQHAGRGLNLEGKLNEISGGLPQTRLIEELAGAKRELLIAKLRAISAFLLTSGRPTASFTGSDDVFEKVRRWLGDWTGKMKLAAPPERAKQFEPFVAPPEGLAAPMNVAYCAMVLPAPRVYHPDAPVLAVGARLVSYNHVLEEVRFKGTAYGGGCAYGASLGTWSFHSYRDPWIWRTLDAYRASLNFVRNSNWSQTEVDRAIIGTAKEFERPIRPGEATSSALWRHLSADSAQRREARHAALLRASSASVKRALLEVFEAGFPKAAVCVVSSRQKLEEANRERPQTPLAIEDILPGESA